MPRFRKNGFAKPELFHSGDEVSCFGKLAQSARPPCSNSPRRTCWIKDFFDLHHLATSFAFDRATLAEAVRRTFARPLKSYPVCNDSGIDRNMAVNGNR